MRRPAVLLALAALVLGGCSVGSDDDSAPTASGSTAEEVEALPLPARWWIWADDFSAGTNPIADPSGESCALHQPDDVWFLAGTYGGSARRACTIPRDQPIYFPVLNLICGVPAGSNASAMEGCTSEPDALDATLDGDPLTIEEQSSGVFSFTARAGGATSMEPGLHDAIAWGHWVGPLQVYPGQHVLTFTGSSGSFEVEVTYDLTVE